MPPPTWRRRARKVWTLILLAVTIVVAGVVAAATLLPYVGGIGLAARTGANKFLNVTCDFKETPPPQKTYIYASDGKTLIATIFDQNREPVSLTKVPNYLTEALVATEDRRFYKHHGVDLRGLIRSAVRDTTNSGSTQGGSTLTMQYVKQVRYYQASDDAERQAAIAPNLDRKLRDAQCALDLEKRNSKQQILQKYLNIAFFGENSYGIATAAKTYFGEPVNQLSLPQAAMLVGLVQAPTQFDPFLHPQAARDRRDQVIHNLVEVGDLSPERASRYMAEPLGLATKKPPPVPDGCAYANPHITNVGFFCDYVVNYLLSHGISPQTLNNAGLRVITTLDAKLQISGEKAIYAAGLKANADYILVMPSVNPRNGAVTTMITSRKYGFDGSDNGQSSEALFTNAYAGAGSTYKYFTALAALEAGAPSDYPLSTPGNKYTTKYCKSGAYTVRNAGDYGPTLPLSEALPQSENTYFVAMEDEFFGCDLQGIVDVALNLGMNRLREPLNSHAAGSIASEVVQSQEPTFTLGQEPTSTLELTGAFAASVNDGIYCAPRPIASIHTEGGHEVSFDNPGCHRAISPQIANRITEMMRQDTRSGTAAHYFTNWYAQGGSDVAAKTGTDNNAKDNGNSALWFVGMTPSLVSAAALVNPLNPKQTVHDLPNMPGDWVGQDVFGAYASTYWQAAYGPELLHKAWEWPEIAPSPDSVDVPEVIGLPPKEAKAQLEAAHFQVAFYPATCGSDITYGDVAFQQPRQAPPGTQITLCLSSGRHPYVYVPPPPPPPPPPPNPNPPATHAPPPHHTHPPKPTTPPPPPPTTRPPVPPPSRPPKHSSHAAASPHSSAAAQG